MPVLPVLSHETRFPGQPHLAQNHGHVLPEPDNVAMDAPLRAFINDGRWLVMCECASAELAHRDDPRFFCSNCGNGAHGGAWRPVTWPKAVAEIEAVLAVRPHRQAQNWNWDASPSELRTENASHGMVP